MSTDTRSKLAKFLSPDSENLKAELAADEHQVSGAAQYAALPPRTHEQTVERRLLAIAWFTGIVAAAVVADFIATLVIAGAAAPSIY